MKMDIFPIDTIINNIDNIVMGLQCFLSQIIKFCLVSLSFIKFWGKKPFSASLFGKKRTTPAFTSQQEIFAIQFT
jgi:hypothetical protein